MARPLTKSTGGEEYGRSVERSPCLRQAAQMRLGGYSNDEIAEKFQRSTVAIERWFTIIRQCWRKRGPS